MDVNGYHLCIGCMHSLIIENSISRKAGRGRTADMPEKICPYCGLEQSKYVPIPRCLIPGTRLANRYILGKVLGEGSFGITYIGWDEVLAIPVAIKEYFPMDMVSRDVVRGSDTNVYVFEKAREEDYQKQLEHFLMEARHLTRFHALSHVASVRDFFYENSTAYIVMEYIEGETLKAHVKNNGVFSGKQTMELMRPVLESFIKIHETGIIHRDVSPDNILTTKEGQLCVIDFGSSRVNNHDMTRSMTVFYKNGFSPEEQYRSNGKQGAYTDIYSICATMYYMMTGIAPPEAMQRIVQDEIQPLSSVVKGQLSEKAEKAIMRGMAVRAADRYQSVKELCNDLYSIEKEVLPKSKVFSYKLPAGLGKKICAAIIIVVCVSGVGWTLSYTMKKQEQKTEASGTKTTDALREEKMRKEVKQIANSAENQSDKTVENKIKMISVCKLSKKRAQNKLSSLKDVTFAIHYQKKYHSHIKKNHIISQSISPGKKIVSGRKYTILLVVSKGKKEEIKNNNQKTEVVSPQWVAPSVTPAPKKEVKKKKNIFDGEI